MIKLMTNLECEQTLLLSSACALVTHELHAFLLLLQKRALPKTGRLKSQQDPLLALHIHRSCMYYGEPNLRLF